ncbi:MAG: Mce-associated rane protein [Mycobacterium sp.]|nr:Mce-associated rane protein [Mycobacterium sp.]
MSADNEAMPDVEPAEGVEPTEAVETDAATDDKDAAAAEIDKAADSADSSSPTRRSLPTIPLIPAALVLGLLAAGGLAGWLYFAQFRPDTQTDNAVAQSAVNAARDGTVALLSYKPDTLNQDFAAARSHLTGDFLNYYDQFTKQVVTPAAQTKAVATTAQVVGAAASELHPNSAVVLVFVNQVTTSKERPDPAMASSSVLVSLTKVHGDWLITKFDPV